MGRYAEPLGPVFLGSPAPTAYARRSTQASGPGTLPGRLESFSRAAGLAEVTGDRLTVSVRFSSLADWWQPFTLGVGPAGAYVASLDDPARDRLRAACADRLPAPPFELAASAWAVRARSPR